jgi:hypothetical protein
MFMNSARLEGRHQNGTRLKDSLGLFQHSAMIHQGWNLGTGIDHSKTGSEVITATETNEP